MLRTRFLSNLFPLVDRGRQIEAMCQDISAVTINGKYLMSGPLYREPCDTSMAVVLNWRSFCFHPFPDNIWRYLETFLIVTNGGVLLAPSGWRPGMLLNILQYIRQCSIVQSYPAPSVRSSEVEKPWGVDIKTCWTWALSSWRGTRTKGNRNEIWIEWGWSRGASTKPWCITTHRVSWSHPS